jgi:hypothetical protein
MKFLPPERGPPPRIGLAVVPASPGFAQRTLQAEGPMSLSHQESESDPEAAGCARGCPSRGGTGAGSTGWENCPPGRLGYLLPILDEWLLAGLPA